MPVILAFGELYLPLAFESAPCVVLTLSNLGKRWSEYSAWLGLFLQGLMHQRVGENEKYHTTIGSALLGIELNMSNITPPHSGSRLSRKSVKKIV